MGDLVRRVGGVGTGPCHIGLVVSLLRGVGQVLGHAVRPLSHGGRDALQNLGFGTCLTE